MKIILLAALLTSLLTIQAQYSTPGTGVVWNMDSLVQNSNAVQLISTNNYRIIEDVTVSAGDSLHSISNNIFFNSGVLITVASGGLYVKGELNFGTLTSSTQGQSFQGFRLEGTSDVVLDSLTINNCGGIKVLTPNFKIVNCTLENNPTGVNTSGFIEVSTGKPQITSNTFRNNEVSAISSAANATVAPVIIGNLFEYNVTGNTNRPQVNLSPSGANDTTYIVNNTVNGDNNNEMVGGIAFSALAGGNGNVVIRNNLITNNRYGITILGNNLKALIDSNKISYNNIQNSPNLGGSGINFNGNTTSYAVVSHNEIIGNLWGVTIQGTFEVNLGDTHIGGNNPGFNFFSENINGGNTYALFNNTPNEVLATNNCWEINEESTLQNVEGVISHNVDDNNLGEVIFNPIMLCNVVGVEEFEESIKVYPNPIKESVFVNLSDDKEIERVEVCTLNGTIILSEFGFNNNRIELNFSSLASGIYFLDVKGSGFIFREKIIKF